MNQDDQPQLNLQNCQLLVVDDEENILKAIRRQLHKKFTVQTAIGAQEAFAILRENRIDVVLSDHQMPGITGTEFLAQVRREFPNTVRLMLTGYADVNTVIAAINDGRVEQYIQKPWDAGQLERIISDSYEVLEIRTTNERLVSELGVALKAEKRFSQLQSDFITLVSHEFRTPLTLIMSSAQIVRSHGARLEPERIEDKLDQIVAQVQHMKSLLEEVIAIGTYEQGIRKFKPETMDICQQFQACIALIKPSLSGKHTIVTDIPEHCSDFVGDAYLITEIVTELITNALKFSTNAGTIICKIHVDSTQAEISIADEGPGILEKDLEHIFTPFVKGENADFVHGIGLGLAIVRHAVNLHQGKIFVEPNERGGTIIRVILPSLLDMVDQQSI